MSGPLLNLLSPNYLRILTGTRGSAAAHVLEALSLHRCSLDKGIGRGREGGWGKTSLVTFVPLLLKHPPPPRDGQGSSGRAVGRLLERGEKRRKKWRKKKKKGGGGGSFLRILPSRLMVTRVHPLVKRLSQPGSGAAPAGPQMSLVTCLPSGARGKPLTYTPYLQAHQPSARGGPVCLRYLVPLSLPLRRAGRDGPYTHTDVTQTPATL